jgi:hypothetical protein
MSRRLFLQRGVLSLGAAGLCRPFGLDTEVHVSVMDKLSAYMSSTVQRALPEEVIEITSSWHLQIMLSLPD